jgi:hypothetical protein
LGLGLHHVHALRQRLPDEGRYSQTGLQPARQLAPRCKRPKGIRNSCDQHIRAGNAMGVPPKILSGCRRCGRRDPHQSTGFEELQVTVDRKGAFMAINQNSREPVTEPDELGPLWKILHLVGADWTYPSVMWAGENYCLFLADDEGWRYILEEFVYHIDNTLGCKHGGQHGVRALLLCNPGRIEKVQNPPQIRVHQHHHATTPSGSAKASSRSTRLEQGPEDQIHGPGPVQHRAQDARAADGR